MSVFLEREHVLLCRHTVPSVDVDLIHLHAKINLTLITLLTKSTQFYLPKLVGSAPVAVACLVSRGNKVRVISTYECVTSKSTLGTVCLQRRRYFLITKNDACPRKLFILHLIQFIAEFISLGLQLILIVDINEHVVKGKLARQMKNLGMVEAFFTNLILKVVLHILEADIR